MGTELVEGGGVGGGVGGWTGARNLTAPNTTRTSITDKHSFFPTKPFPSVSSFSFPTTCLIFGTCYPKARHVPLSALRLLLTCLITSDIVSNS